MSLDKVVEKICQHSKIPEDNARKMIEEKIVELSGLVSREGAAYIVARELGLSLLKESKRQLKAKNLVSGLRSVDFVARVMKVYAPREFDRNGKQGRVMSLLLGDDSGTIRMSLWNDEIDTVEKEKINEGDVVRVNGGYVKTDNRDMLDLRLGRGSIDKTDLVVDVPEHNVIEQRFENVTRKSISEFKEGEYAEVRACLVQMFRKNPLFEICPECGTRMKKVVESEKGSEGDKNAGNKWKCDDHGQVEPKHAMVMTCIIDDGSDNIRAVFFREMAEKIVGKSAQDLFEMIKRDGVDTVMDSIQPLGKEYVLKGRVKRNNFTESVEFVVNEMDDIDVKKECETLLES
jgi:replication factor A1